MVDQEKLSEVKNATISLFQKRWLDNFQNNRSQILSHPGIKALQGKFSTIPTIIIGAGPSLEKNLKYLHSAKGKAIIMCCDAALKVLLSEGITPNLVTTLDPQKDIERFFEGVETDDLTLIAPTIIHPDVLRIWKGRLFFYNKFAPDIPVLTQIQKSVPQVGELTPGGTVLSISYSLAFQMGADPITFAGQDLSFPRGRAYSSGSVYEEIGSKEALERQKGNVVNDEDIFGGEIESIKSMFITKQWMEWAFETWKRNEKTRVYNSTEGGILRDKCRLCPLTEFITSYCHKTYNFDWTLKKLHKRKF